MLPDYPISSGISLFPQLAKYFLLRNRQLRPDRPDYLIEEIKQRVVNQPIVITLCVQLAKAGDPVEDPSAVWPDDRKKRLLGTIESSKATANTEENKKLCFRPNNVTEGIAAADPMLRDRAKIYLVSVQARERGIST